MQLRIKWRPNPKQPIEEYRLLILTFGTKSAPYLATRIIQQLAKDEIQLSSIASKAIQEDMYMDDLITYVKNHNLGTMHF